MTLTILSRIAMIFFIGALAAILFSATTTQKNSICKFQSAGVAFHVADQINQVLNSPLEDERRIVPLDIALSVGGEQTLGYELTINKTEAAEFTRLIFVVRPRGYIACEGAYNIPVDKRFTIHMPTTSDDFLLSQPSALTQKSYALIVMKCRSKRAPFDRHLIINDCKFQTQDKCATFSDYNEECEFP